MLAPFGCSFGRLGSRARSHQHIPHFFFSVASLTHKEKAKKQVCIHTKTAAETNQKEVDVVDVVVGDGTGGHQTISLDNFFGRSFRRAAAFIYEPIKTTTTTTTTGPSSRHIITSRQRKKNQTKTGRNNRREQRNCDDYSTVEKNIRRTTEL
jgi:hypothetical protein